MNSPKEIEFKYKAGSLTEFHEFCSKRDNLVKFIMPSGFDNFYVSAANSGAFFRHRQGSDMNQLTYKKKTVEFNSYVRDEHNIDLRKDMTEAQVRAMCKDLGYEHAGRIYKSCFVYQFKFYTLVYYICYDDEMQEVGRFLEIEMAEDGEWANDQEAYKELLVMEKICKPLGASPQARVKESLCEMFGKKL